MLAKHYDLVVLGAGEIGKAILEKQRYASVLVISREVGEVIEKYHVDGLNWIAGDGSMPAGFTADAVVNCIMPGSKKAALASVDFALKILKNKGIYVHLSTIAVKTSPNNYPSFLNFEGDGYIRIKKAELKYVKEVAPTARIVFPGIVTGGNTGWDKFFRKVRSHKNIEIGANLNCSAPIISLGDLVDRIFNIIDCENSFDSVFMPNPNSPSLMTWRDFFESSGEKNISEKSYLYFPSIIKNILTIILTSSITPDIFWEMLLSRSKARSRSEHKKRSNSNNCISDEDEFKIVGMTNHYVGCRYDIT